MSEDKTLAQLLGVLRLTLEASQQMSNRQEELSEELRIVKHRLSEVEKRLLYDDGK